MLAVKSIGKSTIRLRFCGCSGYFEIVTGYATQAGLELMILLPQSPE
jgi:hypothetical protein